MQRSLQIPLEAAVDLSDPRPDCEPVGTKGSSSQKQLLALPSFALLPAKMAKAAESDGYSWSEAPYEIWEDDAVSAGTIHVCAKLG